MQPIKNVVILTGATGGLGYAFLRELTREPLDEIWAVGRNAERLEQLKGEFEKVVPYCVDLANADALQAFIAHIDACKPKIGLLINNAGIAQMKPSETYDLSDVNGMLDLNCKAPILLINACLPYMTRGSRVINIASASAFQPLPYLNLYASSKAFLRSYSRALNMELKPRGISVTAVCPGWIDTPLLHHTMNGKKVAFTGIVQPERVAVKALKDAKKGKDMSVCALAVKNMHACSKLLPQKTVMKVWLKSIAKYMPQEGEKTK